MSKYKKLICTVLSAAFAVTSIFASTAFAVNKIFIKNEWFNPQKMIGTSSAAADYKAAFKAAMGKVTSNKDIYISLDGVGTVQLYNFIVAKSKDKTVNFAKYSTSDQGKLDAANLPTSSYEYGTPSDTTPPTVLFDGTNYGVAESVYSSTYASVVNETYSINLTKIFAGSDIDQTGYNAVSSNTSNVTVDVANGILNIHSIAVGKATVNVTAKDLTGNVSNPAVFTINVLQSRPQTDQEKLAADKQELSVPSVLTEDMTGTQLLTTGQFGSTISWLSGNTNVLTIDGNGKITKITQPAPLTADATFDVTANLNNNGLTDSQSFPVTVPQEKATASADVSVVPIQALNSIKAVKVRTTNIPGAVQFSIEGNTTVENIDATALDPTVDGSGILYITNDNSVVIDFLDASGNILAKGDLDVSANHTEADVTNIAK